MRLYTKRDMLAEICKDLRFDYCSCIRREKCDSCKLADDLERIYTAKLDKLDGTHVEPKLLVDERPARTVVPAVEPRTDAEREAARSWFLETDW